MSTEHSTRVSGAYRLFFVVDYGTTKLVIAYWIGIPGQRPEPSEIRHITFGNDVGAPQLLAFKDNRCIWGFEVEKLLSTRDPNTTSGRALDYEDVITFLKVTNYPSLEAEALAVDTLDQLRGLRNYFKLPEDTAAHVVKVHALAAHLKGVYEHIRSSIPKSFTNQVTLSQNRLDSLPTHAFFSVPAMWKPPGNRCVTEAAKMAGFENVQLVYEQQAAASALLSQMKINDTSTFAKGARVLIVDAGGGTSDIIVYELQEDTTAGAATKMTPVGIPTGELCGSEFVNVEFLHWLDEKLASDKDAYPRGKAGLLDDLGLTAARFKAQTSASFNAIKHEYKGLTEDKKSVHVDGMRGAKKDAFRIEISEQMKGFFDPVLAKNFDMIHECLEEDGKIEAIIPIGGFSKSVFFLDCLKDRFSKVPRRRDPAGRSSLNSEVFVHIEDGAQRAAIGNNNPVGHGTLLCYSEITPRDLPDTDCYLITQDYIHDPKKHTKKNGYKVVPGDVDSGRQYAKDCATILAPAGRRDPEKTIWFETRIDKHDKHDDEHNRHDDKHDEHNKYTLLQLYWSEKAVKDGVPVFRVKKVAKSRKKDDKGAKKNKAENEEEDELVPVGGIVPFGPPLRWEWPDVQTLAYTYPQFKLCYPENRKHEEAAGVEDEEGNEDEDDEDELDPDFGDPMTAKATTKKGAKSAPKKRKAPATKQRGRVKSLKSAIATPARQQSRSRRAKTTSTRCQHCTDPMNTAVEPQICKLCDEAAYWPVVCRVITHATGAQHHLKVEMAKPNRYEAALKGEPLGPDDVIKLFEDDVVDNKFNPNPLT